MVIKMDRLFVIYKEGEMIESISNGYNTKKGARTVVTQMAKKDLEEEMIFIGKVSEATQEEVEMIEISKTKYEIKEFMNPKEFSIWSFIKRKWKR